MRPPPWLYLPNLRPGPAALDDGEAHHALDVLRLKPADAVVVFDGRGLHAEARLETAAQGRVTLTAGEPRRERPSAPELWLGTAIPRGKRWPALVEKAVEAGVDRIQPIVFARGVAKGEGGPDKARAWVIAACKQSRRAFCPAVEAPVDLATWLSMVPGGARLYGAADGAPFARWAKTVLKASAAGQRVALTVGPEGDFDPDERARLDAAGWRAARWGRHVLRVETAAVLGVAAVRLLASD